MNRKKLLVVSSVLGLIVAALVGIIPSSASATPAGYTFTKLATIPGPAPGPEGGEFTFDFEPYGINNRGEVSFTADVTTGGEGVFLARKGQLSQIARHGQLAPGGGTFGIAVWLPPTLNDTGDVAFAANLDPFFALPLGFHSGVYRFSHVTGLSAVMVPGDTPAPGGGKFQGVFLRTSLNNRGDITFGGIVPTTAGISGTLGMGVFRADTHGQIVSLASPGDPAPGGGTFDFAENPWINDGGDVAFGAHVAGEECIDQGVPQSDRIFCAESVYVMKAATGEIQSIAHQGEPAPGGGTYRFAFGPVLNNRGDLTFIGDLTPAPGFGQDLAVFLHSGGTTIPVARPGDLMPGGGTLVTASFTPSNYHLNNPGDVAFNATLDADANGDGIADTGLYVSSRGSLHLVARTGTVIPGVGTIAHLQPPGLVGNAYPNSGAIINDRGQVFFQATLGDGTTGVLLVATPSS